MNRREFLRQVALWSAAATAIPLFIGNENALASEIEKPLLAVAEDKDYASLVTKTLQPLGGMKAFVKPGDRVVVKPNIGWDRTPEQAANTHPLVVKTLVQLALAAGASQVKVFDRTCNDARSCYQRSGIQPAVESIGDSRAVCQPIDNRRFVPVDIQGGQALDRWEFYRDALDCDCYINVPIAKHHSLGKLTLGLKNVMGVIGGNRGQIHQNLPGKLVDLNKVVSPRLTVIDATRILLRHGPQGGNLDDVKVLDTLIASSDIVAADAYATTLFNLKPTDIPSTVEAHRRGMGQIDLNQVRIVKV